MIYQTVPASFSAKFLYYSKNNKYEASFHDIKHMQQAFFDIHWALNLGILKFGRHSEKTVLAMGWPI